MKKIITGLMLASLVAAPVAMASSDGTAAGSDNAAQYKGVGTLAADLISGGAAATGFALAFLLSSNNKSAGTSATMGSTTTATSTATATASATATK